MAEQVNRTVETLENVMVETRKTIASALSMAEEVSRKHRGSQPACVSSDCAETNEESLISIANDIRRLARDLESELASHHSFLGFERKSPQPMMQRGASALR